MFFVICIECFRSREEIEQWQERQNQVKAEEKRQGEKEVPFSEVTPTAISSSSTISLLKKDIIGGLQPRKLWTSMASHLVRVGYQNQSFLLGVLLFVKYSKHIVIHWALINAPWLYLYTNAIHFLRVFCFVVLKVMEQYPNQSYWF